jgi:hypothetical protein
MRGRRTLKRLSSLSTDTKWKVVMHNYNIFFLKFNAGKRKLM